MIKVVNYPIPEICPYCGSPVIFTSNAVIYGKQYGGGMCYKCVNCDSYVGVHKGTNVPLGILANKELRELKKECHALFDPLWKSNKMTRKEAYGYLANLLSISIDECHFGWFSKEMLQKAKNVLVTLNNETDL